MSSSRHLAIAVVLLGGLVALGVLVVVWPCYRDAAAINREAEVLRRKGENPQGLAAETARLSGELEALRRRVDTGLKVVPESADLAGLIRVLSLPIDGVHVRDQTFTAGEPRAAVPGGDSKARAQPLTVEIQARFDAIFALIRAAESMDRLLRIASANVVCDRGQDEARPLARATLVVEAIYEPPDAEGR